MKKKTLLLSTFIVIALLLALSVPVLAGPPEEAEGVWRY